MSYMPAQAPALSENQLGALHALGERLRQRRQELRLTASAAAESAGMSRWRWGRIEAGEPSVTIGAYVNAAAVLGLVLDLWAPQRAAEVRTPPGQIQLNRYPQLRRLAWQQPGVTSMSAEDALA